jgi:hypothetical protein
MGMPTVETDIKVGDRFGRLVVISERFLDAGRSAYRCRCDCGTEHVVRHTNLLSATRSCGCIGRELSSARQQTHGLTRAGARPPEYACWRGMKARCENPKATGFERYGGRGIRVCDRWRNSFEAFLEDMGRRPSLEYTLERDDNDGPYEPGNVRWATRPEQNRNQRVSRRLTFEGETLPLQDWAERLGFRVQTLHRRLKAGWPVDRAFTTPA